MCHFRSALTVLAVLIAATSCGKKKDTNGSGESDSTEYALKTSFGRRPDSTVRFTYKTNTEMRIELFNPQGQSQKEMKEKGRENKDWTENTFPVKSPDGKWSKLKVAFDRYDVEVVGKSGRKPRLAGKTFIVERNGNAVSFRDESGRPLDSDDETELRKDYGGGNNDQVSGEFIPHRDFLPDKPVRIWQSWDISAAKMAKSLNKNGKMPIDVSGAIAKGRLTRIYERDGHRFGVIEVTASFPIKSDPKLTVNDGSKMQITLTSDGCIDGSVCEGGFKAKIEGAIEGKGPQGTFKMKFDATIEYTETERKTEPLPSGIRS